jgi:hypothetical protein
MRIPEIGDARHLLLTTLELSSVAGEATLTAQQLCVISKANLQHNATPGLHGSQAPAWILDL